MVVLHLHFLGRDTPLGGFQIDLRPFRVAQHVGTDEHQWRQFERRPAIGMALVAVDRAEQCANFDGFRNRGEMPLGALLELRRNACSRVPLDEFLDHRQLENLADVSKHTAHRIDNAACLHALHDIQDVGRTQAVDRDVADERKDVALKPADDALLRCLAACTCRGR